MYFFLTSYQKYIERIVYSNLQQAQLGGVPGVFFLVKSFLKIRPLLAISHELEVGATADSNKTHLVWIFYQQ